MLLRPPSLLLLPLYLASTVSRGFAKPLAMRQALQQRVWSEYLLGSSDASTFSSSQSTVKLLQGASSLSRAAQAYNVHYFQQKVDHFGLNDTTFKQRIYINGDSYAADGPVYLFNSGETPASPSYLIAGEPYNLAKATNGMVIIMEHRYYGDSYPVDDLSGPNMKYLTVENALEDIAYFIRNSATFVQSAIGVTITPQSKWVATGGSYSANLAVWARLEYPDLIHAAYASSAPVLAEIDFYQYDQVVGRALPCAQSIADAVLALDTILDSQDRGLIDSWKKTFGLELLKDDADFAGALTDQLSITVQYYMPPVAGSNSSDSIATLCSWFSRTQHTPLQNLADMTSAYIRNNNIDTVAAYSSYAGAKNTGLHQDGRAWFYQTCTQFGYWQTAPQPPLRRLRSKYMTVEWQSSPCSAFFGDSITGHANVGSINRKYGGLLPNVTRVVFVNGLMDPWSELSVGVDTPTSKRVAEMGQNAVITMSKASHVTDFYFANTRTAFGVSIARQRILQAIQVFLSE